MVSHDLEMLGILYTHLGRIASDTQILEVEGGWTWVDPLKPISPTGGEADECLRG